MPIAPVIHLEHGDSENGILSSILILWIYFLDNHLPQINQAKEKLFISRGNTWRWQLSDSANVNFKWI